MKIAVLDTPSISVKISETLCNNQHEAIHALKMTAARHETIREYLLNAPAPFSLYDAGSHMAYRFTVSDTGITLNDCFESEQAPDADTLFIVEDGFCHSAHAIEINDIPDPLGLVWKKAAIAKSAKRCGCCACGAIFSGADIKKVIKGVRGQEDFALCPECGMNEVIAEDEGVHITEDNLWRWHMALDDCYPLPEAVR